jgi:hypothetical protein
LQTGGVPLRKPTIQEFEKVTELSIEWGAQVDLSRVENAYFHSRVLTTRQYVSMIKLLEIFAEDLSMVANQIVLQR